MFLTVKDSVRKLEKTHCPWHKCDSGCAAPNRKTAKAAAISYCGKHGPPTPAIQEKENSVFFNRNGVVYCKSTFPKCLGCKKNAFRQLIFIC